MAQSFKDAFCACYRCRPEEFSSKAIGECLYPHARAVWPIADLFGARATLAAASLMEMLAEARSNDDVKEVIEQYLQDVYPHIGFIGEVIKVRISTKRLLALSHSLFQQHQPAAPRPSIATV